eukprot:TRINITY_DN27670_c0_g1_i1.p1 TRINITY_DN27670_c0_g1~~TRINITY_DN27670_c0_g1_i1.p1  ORF type:complete len:426 (-),score=73.68 TRINITY_DN27670_c0_g1_i1:73-1323(-)
MPTPWVSALSVSRPRSAGRTVPLARAGGHFAAVAVSHTPVVTSSAEQQRRTESEGLSPRAIAPVESLTRLSSYQTVGSSISASSSAGTPAAPSHFSSASGSSTMLPPRRAGSPPGRAQKERELLQVHVRPRSAGRLGGGGGAHSSPDLIALCGSARRAGSIEPPIRGSKPAKASPIRMRGARSGEASQSPEPPRARRPSPPRPEDFGIRRQNIPARSAASPRGLASQEEDVPTSLVAVLARIAQAVERGAGSGSGAAAAAAIATALATGGACGPGGSSSHSKDNCSSGMGSQAMTIVPQLLTELEGRVGQIEQSIVELHPPFSGSSAREEGLRARCARLEHEVAELRAQLARRMEAAAEDAAASRRAAEEAKAEAASVRAELSRVLSLLPQAAPAASASVAEPAAYFPHSARRTYH